MIVFDHDGLVGLCDGLSVDCDFNHLSNVQGFWSSAVCGNE